MNRHPTSTRQPKHTKNAEKNARECHRWIYIKNLSISSTDLTSFCINAIQPACLVMKTVPKTQFLEKFKSLQSDLFHNRCRSHRNPRTQGSHKTKTQDIID
ncbi:hypothetical protein V6Z12_D06G098800 [Gossypium hirsutum]